MPDITDFWNMVQVLRRPQGRARTPEEVKRRCVNPAHAWLQPIEFWNGAKDGQRHHRPIGSQNHPQHAHAGAGHWELLRDLAAFELKNGLYSREHGSPYYYFVGPLAAKMVGLRLATVEGDDEAVETFRRWFYAVFILEALAAVSLDEPVKNFWWRHPMTEPQPQETQPGPDYRGVFVASAGMRFSVKGFSEPSSGTPKDKQVAWALEHERHDPRNRRINRRTQRAFSEQVVAELCDVSNYHDPTPAEDWGLSEDRRELLRRVIAGDVPAALEAVGWFNAHGIPGAYKAFRQGRPAPPASQRLRVRRTERGVETICFRSVNGNKAGIQYCAVDQERKTRIFAAGVRHENRSGSNVGWGVRFNKRRRKVHLSGTAFGKATAPPDHLGSDFKLDTLPGEVLYDLLLTPKRIRVL